MSGKAVRIFVGTVLLALAMAISSPVAGVSSPAQGVAPAPLAMELGTTAS